VNTCDRGHATPLHLACCTRDLESVRVLLDHGANVNARDNHDQTPLHQVLTHLLFKHNPKDRFGVAQLLVERGADVNARDSDHETFIWHPNTTFPDRTSSWCRCSSTMAQISTRRTARDNPVSPKTSVQAFLPRIFRCCTAVSRAWRGREHREKSIKCSTRMIKPCYIWHPTD
jgi:hypothetical protein